MLIYNSMIAWIGVVAFFYSVTRNRVITEGKNTGKVPLLIAIVVFAYIIFWVGMRSGVADTGTYIGIFEAYETGFDGIAEALNSLKAPGFELYGVLLKTVNDSYHVWLMSIAIISGVAVMITLWKHSENFFYSAFLFIVSLNFFWMLNGMRQFVAASLLFLAAVWIAEKKPVPFFAVTLLLMTVHFTAVLLIPLYFAVSRKPLGKEMFAAIALMLLFVIFLRPALNLLETALEGTAYSGATSQFSEDDGVNPIRFAFLVLPPCLTIVFKDRIAQENDAYLNVCVNMSWMCAGLYFIGLFTSGILIGRLPIYCELYNLILIPWVLEKCFKEGSSKSLAYLICTLAFLAYYVMQMSNSYYISDLTGIIH